ncbi:glycosyltransferase involved in cell wall biosynthesis [Friedmanniella antarctica]|uniref:4,4'-diaponeurosporenoate glycosyltransferase n=1 Tax=Microlunatus antarcticus TaxID=53388 RepID=A0A7W5JU49_9ACTN|nr:glycosyltransferase involved in cell wall biosynthesis [Microlunatus antarcticus]
MRSHRCASDDGGRRMISVVIAAHDEAAVIGRCLQALRDQRGAGPVQVVVVANGCHDNTAEVAERAGASVVISVPEPGKSAALVVGDAAAVGFPRVYLDADIELPAHALAACEQVLAADPTILAAAPRRHVVSTGSSLLVRAYTAVSSRHPAYDNSLFGRGMIVLSEDGRRRFDQFPAVVADDLYLDSLYAETEKGSIDAVDLAIAAPSTTRALLRRLVRVRRGNADLRSSIEARGAGATASGPDVRRSDRLAWLREVVLPQPRLLPAGLVYVGLTSVAALLARLGSRRDVAWGQDRTARRSPDGPTASSGPIS